MLLQRNLCLRKRHFDLGIFQLYASTGQTLAKVYWSNLATLFVPSIILPLPYLSTYYEQSQEVSF